MKTFTRYLLLSGLLFLLGCNQESLGPAADFRVSINNSTVITGRDIDFYDFSSHLIYLKSNKAVLKETDQGQFSVYAGDQEIYSGTILPMYASYLPKGPVIYTRPTLYNDGVLPIGFIQITDQNGQGTPDLRNDARIVDALRQAGQYREGLACEVVSARVTEPGKVALELRLTNRDEEDLYYLDPDKMGMSLFHYFTNGLSFRGANLTSYTHRVPVEEPKPWNSWKREWLSVLKGHESKLITLAYDDFDDIPAGSYNANFTFPGLSFQVEKKDIRQGNGRIWLGQILARKEVNVP